jgi:hypothetical protein
VSRFFHGVASIAEQTRRLAPGQDSLRRGLERLRLLALAEDLRRFSGTRGLGYSFERQATALFELPRRLDQAIDRLSRERERASRKPRQRDAWAAVLVLLMAVSAVILAAQHVVASGAPAWVEGLGGGIAAALGLVLLRVIAKAR